MLTINIDQQDLTYFIEVINGNNPDTIAQYETTHPQRTVLSILKELGIAGKRGRVRGRKYPKLREKNLEEAKKLLDEQGIKY